MVDERIEDLGPDARTRRRRARVATYMVIGLLILDFFTLVFAIAVFIRQEGFNEDIHDGLCRGNGISINRIVQAGERSNEETFKTFFPDVSDEEINAALAQQKFQDANQIVDLAEGCTPGELGSDAKVIDDARALVQEDE